MSSSSFMQGGEGELVREWPTPANHPYNAVIKIYEIGELGFVGVVYGKGDKQVQPRCWWEGRIPPPPALGFKLQPRSKAAPPVPFQTQTVQGDVALKKIPLRKRT